MSSKPFESESLHSPNAYQLLRTMVLEEEASTSELAESTDSSYGMASSYLTSLNNDELVKKEKDGRTVYYSVNYVGFLNRILDEAIEELERSEVENESRYEESYRIVERKRPSIAGLVKNHIEIHMKLEKDSNIQEMVFKKFLATLEHLDETNSDLDERTIEAISDTLKLANGIYLTEDYVSELEARDLSEKLDVPKERSGDLD